MLAIVLSLCAGGGGVSRAATDFPAFGSRVLARGLKSPDGIALDPTSGQLLVSEKAADRISVVSKEGGVAPLLSGGWTLTEPVAAWAVSTTQPEDYWTDTQLHSPGPMAFSTNGNLFVVEDRPRGRLMEFFRGPDGQFKTARAIPVPWLDRSYAWDDVKVATDGRLFLAGASTESGFGLYFGVVLMRSVEGDWWVVDYGPMLNFASLFLSKFEDVLVVCERTSGTLVWWDAIRFLPIGRVNAPFARTAADSVSLLADGSFVIAGRVGSAAKGAADGYSILRIDPLTTDTNTIATGKGFLGTLLLNNKSGSLYATETQNGQLIEFFPQKPVPTQPYLIKRSLTGYEMAEGLTPHEKDTPAFLKSFFTTVKERKAGGASSGIGMGMSYELKDVVDRVPLVAAKVRTQPTGPITNADPVTEINFVMLYPGRSVNVEEFSTPSLGMFSARHQSGKLEGTKEFGMLAQKKNEQGEWVKLTNSSASVLIPMITTSVKRKAGGVRVNIMAMGMGLFDDYYLELESGFQNKGKLTVESRNGETAIYDANFTDVLDTGAEVNNLVVAGYNPLKHDKPGWLNIGRFPMGAAVAQEDESLPFFSSSSEDILKMLEQRDLDWRVGADKTNLVDSAAALTPTNLPAP